jgi:hypothetical protein
MEPSAEGKASSVGEGGNSSRTAGSCRSSEGEWNSYLRFSFLDSESWKCSAVGVACCEPRRSRSLSWLSFAWSVEIVKPVGRWFSTIDWLRSTCSQLVKAVVIMEGL